VLESRGGRAFLLIELYGRIPPLAREAVEGLDADQLVAEPEPGVNPIGWLLASREGAG